MINLVEKLIPKKGFLWRIFPGYFQDLLNALNKEPERIRDFLKSVVREMNPGTAIDTQEEWYQQFGLTYESTKSLAEKQAETLERYVALGGQDITYLQEQVNRAGFAGITLVENFTVGAYGADWIFYYFVNGEVDNDAEALRLKTLLQKIAPGHLVPEYNISSSDNVCNVARCGYSVCDG